MELPDPKQSADPVVIGCDPGVRIDLVVARDQSGPAHAFVSPEGLKRIHGDESDRLRSARATNTRKGSRKYKRLSRAMVKTSRRRTNRTVEWERHVACEVVDMGEVIGLADTDFHGLAKSAKGTRKRRGTNVGATRRRNRSLRYARPGALARRCRGPGCENRAHPSTELIPNSQASGARPVATRAGTTARSKRCSTANSVVTRTTTTPTPPRTSRRRRVRPGRRNRGHVQSLVSGKAVGAPY